MRRVLVVLCWAVAAAWSPRVQHRSRGCGLRMSSTEETREVLARVAFSSGCKKKPLKAFTKMWLAGRDGWRLVDADNCVVGCLEEDGSGAIMGTCKIDVRDKGLAIESSGGNFLYDLREASLIGAYLTELWEIWNENEEADVDAEKRLFNFSPDDINEFAEKRRRFAETI